MTHKSMYLIERYSRVHSFCLHVMIRRMLVWKVQVWNVKLLNV